MLVEGERLDRLLPTLSSGGSYCHKVLLKFEFTFYQSGISDMYAFLSYIYNLISNYVFRIPWN
jgi:hypothetical protein